MSSMNSFDFGTKVVALIKTIHPKIFNIFKQMFLNFFYFLFTYFYLGNGSRRDNTLWKWIQTKLLKKNCGVEQINISPIYIQITDLIWGNNWLF